MKTYASAFVGIALAASLSACTSKDKAGHAADASGVARFEELTTAVPSEFSDAEKWNKQDLCPEGAKLSPFTRYTYEADQKNHGFKNYYGRSCDIVRAHDDELNARQPASASDSLMTIPHGPYIWWYENGKRMEAGTFDHGTDSTEHAMYEPDGSIAAKD